jgi:RHS repeat-associated protein
LVPLVGGMATSPDGSLFFSGDSRVLRFRTPLPSVGPDTMLVPSESGAEIYVFDGKGRHLRTLDGVTLSEQLHFTYDAQGYLTRIEDPDANALVIDRDAMEHGTTIHAPFGQLTSLAYDGAGHLAKVTDALARTTSVTMDAGALLTQLVDPNGGVHAMKYGPDGRLTQDASPAGATWSMTRSEDSGAHVTIKTALGRSRTHEVLFSAGGDETRSVTREDGTRTGWTIGQDGKTRVIAADGTITDDQNVADPRFGMVASFVGAHTVTFPSGLVTISSAERTATMAADGLTPTQLQTTTHDADGTWTTFYDAASRTTTTTTPQGRTLRTGVDARGRLIDIKVPGIVPIALAYDARGHVATAAQGVRKLDYVYDASTGYLSEVHDAEGRVLKTVRDVAGRVTSLVRPDGAATSLGFDNDDNLVGVTPPGKSAHAMTYNKDDRLSSYLAPGGTTTLYGYDLDRGVTDITNPDGAKPVFAHDAAGRVSSLTYGGGSVQSAYSSSSGQLSQLTGPSGNTLAYTYDGSLLTSVKAQGAAPGMVSWTYDGKVRVATETVGGSAITLARDSDGLLTGAGQWAATLDPASGRVMTATVGGVSWAYAYTIFGEVESLHVTTGAGPLLDVAYTYDKLSRIVTKSEANNGGATTAWGYGYDLAGRLTTVTKDGAMASTYAYDANGNRTDGGAAVDAQDRLLSGFGATYTYTPNGEVATKTDGAGLTRYSYDGRGVLVGAALPASHSVAYGLDAVGRRVSRTYDSAVTHRWVYRNGLQIGAEVDVAGSVLSRFVYGGMSQTPAYMDRGGVTYAFVTDHLASVRFVVRQSDGVIMQALTYDPWGKVTSDTSPGFQPFGFAGGVYDLATGLVRFGARDYDPAVGRWTSKDPIRFAGGLNLSWGWNLYEYAQSDPINVIDTSGRAPTQVLVRVVNLIERKGLQLLERVGLEEAAGIAARGGDLLLKNEGEAQKLARRASGGRCPVRHSDAFGDHFHPVGPNGEKLPNHIFFGDRNQILGAIPLVLDLDSDGDVGPSDFFELFAPWLPFFPEEYLSGHRTDGA